MRSRAKYSGGSSSSSSSHKSLCQLRSLLLQQRTSVLPSPLLLLPRSPVLLQPHGLSNLRSLHLRSSSSSSSSSSRFVLLNPGAECKSSTIFVVPRARAASDDVGLCEKC
jgi:hypothetical protein